MNTLFLIARIAGERVALPAADIGSVVEVEEIAPVSRVPGHIAGLFALRSRVLTVVDTCAALGLPPMPRDGVATAIITDHDGQSYALLVEEVEDVIEADAPTPCPALVAPAWRRAAQGTIRRGDEAILLVSAAALVAGPEMLAA
jgi:purine-binding chemotaxis protein CheW